MTNTALNNLWTYIDGLNLSRRNRKWLAERLIETPAKPADKADDPTVMSKKEFYDMLDEAEAQIARGECDEMMPGESVNSFLNRLGYGI